MIKYTPKNAFYIITLGNDIESRRCNKVFLNRNGYLISQSKICGKNFCVICRHL